MPATPFDSRITGALFHDAELAALFTEEAEIAAMLAVEAALARVQGRLGLIPAGAAEALAAALPGLAIDPAALAAETEANGVAVPALVAAARRALPEAAAAWLHWGATSQDIQDSALMLRLRAVLGIFEGRIAALLEGLARQARTHAALPMAARTYGQTATPTTFGATVAMWGRPLLALRAELAALRPRLLAVSLGGAAGTLSAMGGRGAAVRAALAAELGLADPGAGWHAERGRIGALAAWAGGVAAALGKMGEDLILLAQSGIEEVALPGGGSSTMPQKVNPVLPSALVALARHALALAGALQGAGLHRQNRDGAAWFQEWLALPPLLMATGRALAHAGTLAQTMAPRPGRMAANLDDGTGLVHAEALVFALAARMPRPAAQAAVAALCAEVRATGRPLPELAAARWPEAGLGPRLRPEAQLGEAPAEARAFAAAVLGPGPEPAAPGGGGAAG